MKSNKQRRAELRAKKASKGEAKRKATERKAKQAALASGHSVDSNQLNPDGMDCLQPYFVRRGYYVDQPFQCEACGEAQNWTASQQKWWYEVAKGNVWTTARLCRPCRQAERARRDEAQRVHTEGLARKLGQDDAKLQAD